MSADSCSVPPKDRAIEGIQWMIETGAVDFGGRLPGERDLCERLGVSRTALRGAIKQLCSQGVLESRHGSGTYVFPRKLTQIFQHSGGFSELVAATGRTPRSHVVVSESMAADERTAKKMKLAEGSPVFKLMRVRLADDAPVSIETSYTDLSRFPGIEGHDFEKESLLRVIKGEYGVQVAHGVERLSITRLNEWEADLLKVEAGTPAFFEQCFNQDAGGAVIEYCRAVNLANRFQYANDDSRSGKASGRVLEWLRS